jgi:hypothetical protein
MSEDSTVKVTILGKAKDGMRAMREYSAVHADVTASAEVKGRALIDALDVLNGREQRTVNPAEVRKLEDDELAAAKALLKAKFEDESE